MNAKPQLKQGTIGEAIEGSPTSDTPAPAAVQKAATQTEALELRKRDIAVGRFGIEIKDLETLARFATMVVRSELAPKGFETAEKAAIAIQMGMELGQTPLWGLQNIAVINNRPAVYGDGLAGLVMASPLCEYAQTSVEGEGESMKGVSIVKRRGAPASRSEFTVGDAKTAGLWGKAGPWTQYPKRMLRSRAHNFNLRDTFPDLTKGVKTVEELRDYSETVEIELDEMPKRLSKTAPAPAPAPARAAELDGDPVHLISGVTKSASGTDDAGKPFNVWSVKTRSGLVCETRSDGIAAQAKKAQADDRPVRLEMSPGDGDPQINALTIL